MGLMEWLMPGFVVAWFGAKLVGMILSPIRDSIFRRDDSGASDPQIAGSACVQCLRTIVTDVEGGLCRRCEQPIHRECARAHRQDAHAEPKQGVYR